MDGLKRIILFFLLGMINFSLGCPDSHQILVVVYSSVDQHYSEPILDMFEQTTGIKVLPVYDVEAAKTTGMVNRLIAEKDNPQADVFWSGEFVQTIRLKDEGILAEYRSDMCDLVPDEFVDPDGYWTGFAGRARILIVNSELTALEDYPDSIYDFLDEKWPADKLGIAYPMFGTSSTHAAALYAVWGDEAAGSFFEAVRERGIRVVDGNSVVRNMVVDGELWWGLTDTDDACTAINDGAPVEIVIPDQDEGDLGTLVIPNTVALIEGAPNAGAGKAFIDYLLSVEDQLVESGWCHIPLIEKDTESQCLDTSGIRWMDTALSDVYDYLEISHSELSEIFIR